MRLATLHVRLGVLSLLVVIATMGCHSSSQVSTLPMPHSIPLAASVTPATTWNNRPLLKPEPVNAPTPTLGPARPSEFGMQIHGCSPQPAAEAIDGVAHAGFTWVKQQVRWDEVEGVRGARAWKCIDEVVRLAHARGLKVLLSVTTAPAWAKTGTGGLAGPPDAGPLADFAADLVRRYKGQVHAIEVFNEPNLAMEWGDRLSPNYYARMLMDVSEAIKRIDPQVMVISAGLAPTRWNDWGEAIDDLQYVETVGSNVAYYADCVGAHFNDGVSSPLSPGSPFEQLVTDYRALTGQARPICLTEFGIATPVNGKTPKGFHWASKTTPEQQAQWLVDGLQWARAHPGVLRLVVVWNLNYYGGEDDPNSLYALWTPMGMRPAYEALKKFLGH